MRLLGIKGEDLAEKFLKGKGYRIIHRNFKTPVGEMDIIAEDRDTIVFVEVKTRAGDSFGHPFEAVDYRKRERLKKVALYYLKHHKKNSPLRFDVLSIEMDGYRNRVEHIIDAFE